MVRTTYQPGIETGIGSVDEDEDGACEGADSPEWIEDEDGTEGEAKVLHIDDSADFVEMAAIYLQKGNDSLDVETETDPVEALERLDEEEFDCVVSDCSMPDMDMNGMELHQEVRSEHPNLSFVFFTGTPISEFPEEVIADEDTGHMQKEIDVKQFSNLAGWITETVE